MKLSLTHPTLPFLVTQEWGVPNPIYKPFGFTAHNGVDFKLGKDAKLVAPHGGVVSQIGWQPNGAGLYICIRSVEPYGFADGLYFVESTMMHLAATKLSVGTEVRAGDEIAVADNTGFSTGPHTHWRLQRLKLVRGRWVVVDKNDAQNSIDPMMYLAKQTRFTFTRDLQLGDDHPDVRELQKFLNASGFPVSVSGAGSSGRETTYFGEKTRVALATFQAANRIYPPQGYLGAKTREVISRS